MSSFVYEPVAPSPTDGLQHRVSVDTLKGKVVGFIDNSKSNFDHLVDELSELLQKEYGVKAVVKHKKRMASIPAPQEVLDDISAKCDVVITGAGD